MIWSRRPTITLKNLRMVAPDVIRLRVPSDAKVTNSQS